MTDNAASVKVIETYPASVYVDYLNMLQIAGEWRIVNKIYTSRRQFNEALATGKYDSMFGQ